MSHLVKADLSCRYRQVAVDMQAAADSYPITDRYQLPALGNQYCFGGLSCTCMHRGPEHVTRREGQQQQAESLHLLNDSLGSQLVESLYREYTERSHE